MTPTAAPNDPLLGTAPHLSDADALAVLTTHWGITGHLTRLSSERDLNFLVRTDQNAFVLKIANPQEPILVTDFQTKALLHLADCAPTLPVPRVIPSRDGSAMVYAPQGTIRLLSYLKGELLHKAAPSSRLRRSVGAIAAQISNGLTGFSHPAEQHFLQWDLKNAAHLRPMLADISDVDLRTRATTALDHFNEYVQPALANCRQQVVHNDLNPHNIVLDPADHGVVAGIIDFGDMVKTPLVCDLAIAAGYLIDSGNPEQSIAAVVESFHQHLPLTKSELSLVYDLVLLRYVTTLAITSHRAALFPQNAAYILRNFASASMGFLALSAVNRTEFCLALAKRCLTRTT
jgi:hydroxylysine kinase